jgi:hypothetical protein
MLFVGACGSSLSNAFLPASVPPVEPDAKPVYPSLLSPAPRPPDPKPVLTDAEQKDASGALEKAAVDREAKVKRRLERDKN